MASFLEVLASKLPKRKKKEAKVIEYEKVDTSGLKLVLREGAISTEKLEKIQKVMKILSTILVYAFLAFMAIVIILPFYWMLITSLKNNNEIRDMTTFWPTVVLWSNYVYVFRTFHFTTYLMNTLLVGIISTLGTLITTILAAFAFAKLNFRGKDALFMVLLATMMIPGEMMVITNYITVSTFGWMSNTDGSVIGAYACMIVPFWVSVFYIYLLRQNFKQIPNELYLAAKVDGKSDWNFLWKVLVPLSSPTLISIFILKLMGAWNSYVWPNLVVNNDNQYLITVALRKASFTTTGGATGDQGLLMAATVIVTVPLLLLFIFARKYIMKGVGRAGIKG